MADCPNIGTKARILLLRNAPANAGTTYRTDGAEDAGDTRCYKHTAPMVLKSVRLLLLYTRSYKRLT